MIERQQSEDTLNEREFELINIVGEKLGANQRDISRLMDMSLGMTNMLVRRLVQKGHIRIHQLNKRKMEYILTPKGFAEKTRKSVMYTLKTINSLGLIKNRVRELIQRRYEAGCRAFYVYGSSDLVTLIEMVFHQGKFPGVVVKRINNLNEGAGGLILGCCEDVSGRAKAVGNYIDVIEELSRDPLACAMKREPSLREHERSSE